MFSLRKNLEVAAVAVLAAELGHRLQKRRAVPGAGQHLRFTRVAAGRPRFEEAAFVNVTAHGGDFSFNSGQDAALPIFVLDGQRKFGNNRVQS